MTSCKRWMRKRDNTAFLSAKKIMFGSGFKRRTYAMSMTGWRTRMLRDFWAIIGQDRQFLFYIGRDGMKTGGTRIRGIIWIGSKIGFLRDFSSR